MRRHLSDEELGKVVIDGPAKLAAHSDDLAHQHIVHELCPECVMKLINLIVLHVSTEGANKH